METTHSANVKRNYNANIVSVNQEEASDKIRIGDLMYSSIPDDYDSIGLKPIKYRNAVDALAFHMPPYTSTILSKPGTSAIRGGKKDMYYDEAAHIPQFRRLYQAGLPAITRGDGRVSVISTPLGQSGLYFELWNEDMWSHHVVPWWESRFMVNHGLEVPNPYETVVAEAMSLAPEMGTEERVERFGSPKLQRIFAATGDIVMFQTEYECMFVDETEAYYPMDLIVSCVDENLPVYKEYPIGYDPDGVISVGVDLAKERDESVFTVVDNYEVDGEDKKRVVYMYATQSDYDEQFKTLKSLVGKSGARRVTIDATGPGAMFHERARKEGLGPGVNVEGVSFTNAKKENWATRFKGDLQTKRVRYPNSRDLKNQIHGIRRTKTENGNFKFSGKRDDRFWSLMLGAYGEGRRPVRFHALR